jgi:hypothetical protein
LRGVLGHPLVAGQYECQTKYMSVLAPVEVVEGQRLATRLGLRFDSGGRLATYVDCGFDGGRRRLD